jgi:hypothetical protein
MVVPCTSSIQVLFGQSAKAQIPSGTTLWFSAVLERVDSAHDDLTTPIRIDVRQSQITFGKWPYTIVMPDSAIRLDASVTEPQRWWVPHRFAWYVTLTPSQLPEAFFDGMPFTVPEPFLPQDIGPVTWTATFTASRPGVTLRWAWSAAVYSHFGVNGQLLVKPLSAPLGEPQTFRYQNNDPAGTPELFKDFAVAGAMGSGASPYTGDRSEPATVRACVSNEPQPQPR